MAVGSLLQIYPFDFKPSAPPSGQFLIYAKTDNTLYIQDSTGTEYAFGSTTAITQLSGEATGIGPGNATVTLSNSAIIGKVLTGFISGPNSTVLSTDTLLQAIQKLQAQVTASSGSAITALTGDVSAAGPGSASATVNSVGGSNAANIHNAELAANAATPTNISSTIVKRDASGNFSANVITASLAGNATTATTAISFSGSLSGDVTGPQGSTVVATVGGKTASDISAAVTTVDAATSANTPSTLVERDPSGNFHAGTITANLTGNASGSSSSFTGSLAGDVTGTQSATVVSTVGGKTSSDIASAVTTVDAATSINTASTLVERDASGNFAAGTVTANLTGNVTGNVSGSSASFTGSLVGDVSGTQGATSVDKIKGVVVNATPPTDAQLLLYNSSTTQYVPKSLAGDVTTDHGGNTTVNTVGGSSATNIHSAELAANAATSANTPSTIVARDGSGNFSAGTITAALSGNATTATTSTNFSGSLSGDVTGTQTTTSISATTVTGKLLTGYTVGPNTAVAATDSILTSVEKLQGQINATVGGAITALTGDVTATGPGSSVATITTAAPTTNLDSTTTNTAGAVAHSFSNSAHTHAITTATPVTQVPDQSNAAGSAAGLAKADHIHNIPSAVPVQVGTSNIQGSAASFSLSDHVHSHGNQTVGTLHAAVTSSVNGFMISTDKSKLDASTNANTPSTLVQRDASGNFSAGTITANLTGTATNATTAVNFSGSLTGDVTGTQSATVIPAGTVTDTKAALAVKPAVTVVATTNQTLSGTPIIDGQTTTAGTSTALLTAQTTTSQNGPWVIQTGAWTRPTWFPSGGTTQAFQFITVFIRLGTVYGGSTWRMTTAGAIIIDTTAMTWVVTPVKGNFNSTYTVGTQTGSSEVDLMFANANTGTLGWNPGSAIKILLPPTNPTVIGQHLISTDTAGTLAWSNVLPNAAFITKVIALTDAANITTDASLGNIFTITIAGNRNLSAPTNPTDGQRIMYRIKQDGTGNRGLTFDAIFNFGLDIISFTPTTGANKTDYIGCIYNGPNSKWDVVAVSKSF